jgi:hypothetical protein
VSVFLLINILYFSCNGFNYTNSGTCNLFVLEKEKYASQQNPSSLDSIYMNVNKPDSELLQKTGKFKNREKTCNITKTVSNLTIET